MPAENLPTQDDTKPTDTPAQNQPPTLLGSQAKVADDSGKPDAKTDGQKPPVDGEKSKEGEKKDEQKAEGAPEAYEPFKVPDGVEIDQKANEEFIVTAKEMNLSQAQAQKLIDLATKNSSEGMQKIAAQQSEQWAKTREAWATEIKADKEFGGANFKASHEFALRAVNKFGDQQVRKEVFDSGWGDHPALFRMFVKIGKAMSEDQLIDGDKPLKERSAADVMYPSK